MRRRRYRVPRHPSSVPYERLVGRRIAAIRARVRAALVSAIRGDADELTDAELQSALSRLLAEVGLMTASHSAPRAAEVRTAGSKAALTATQGQRAALVRAGMPVATLASRIGLELDGGIPLRLSPGEEVLIQQWATEGAWLIRTAELDLFDDLQVAARELTAEGATTGLRWETVAQRMMDRVDVGASRARLIARDQTAKLNGRITQHLQGAAGVTHYVWRASHDARVRESHAAADGRTYAWATGAPGTGIHGEASNPGQSIQCRCTAEPVITL